MLKIPFMYVTDRKKIVGKVAYIEGDDRDFQELSTAERDELVKQYLKEHPNA